MGHILQACCICEAEAAWMRVRMPNGEQMTYLCQHHYQALDKRNPILASYYDALTPLPPMETSTMSVPGGNANRSS